MEKNYLNENIDIDYLLNLQRDYEDGKITEEEMSKEQVIELKRLYEAQISVLKEDYIAYGKRILELKKKIDESGK